MAVSSFLRGLAVLAIVTAAAASSSLSCSGLCDDGVHTSYTNTCFCDPLCSVKGDCCSDAQQLCSDNFPHAEKGSCAGNCGQYALIIADDGSLAGTCYCDAIATFYGDACSDYSNACADVPSPPFNPPPGSCKGHCGAFDHPADNPSYATCYCDNYCEHHGDCCADKHDLCQGTCDGFCGYLGSDQSCYCDSVCQQANDCCGDYLEFCKLSNVTAPAPGSCQGQCGGCNDGADQCCCDYICTYLGDCCEDKPTYCKANGDANLDCLSIYGCQGNMIGNAIPVPDNKLPFHVEGTTDGFNSSNYFGVSDCHDGTAPDVFYSFTPPQNMTVKASLCGSTTKFKSALYIVDAAADMALNYECNNRTDRAGCEPDQAEVVALLTKDKTYYFVVDGKGGDSGAYSLDITSELGDSMNSPYDITSLPYDVEGSTTFYTNQFKSKAVSCDIAKTNDVFYRYVALNGNEVLSVQLCAEFAASLIVVQETDNQNLKVIQPSKCQGLNITKTQCELGLNTLSVAVTEPHVYFFIIKGQNGLNQPTYGDYRMIISSQPGDSLANPIAIPSTNVNYTTKLRIGDFMDAHQLSSSCVKGDYQPSPDVIFSYVPPTDMDIVVNTCGSEFDTVLSIVTYNTSSSTKTTLSCNDDKGVQNCVRGSEIAFHVQASIPYFFIVDGYETSSVNEKLNFKLLLNQDCREAQSCLVQYPFPASNGYTVKGPTSPSIVPAQNMYKPKASCLSQNVKDVKNAGFYRFETGNTGAKIQVNACPLNNDGDPILQVYRKDANGMTHIACDDNSSLQCSTTGAAVTFEADAFRTYILVVQTASPDLEYELVFYDNGTLANTCKVNQGGNVIGNLCGNVGASGSCYCDNYAAIPSIGKACDDYKDVCGSIAVSGTCAADDCGSQASTGKCMCSSLCTIFNNCCSNHKDVCASDGTLAKNGSSFTNAIFIPTLPYRHTAQTEDPVTVRLPSEVCKIGGSSLSQKIFKFPTSNVRYVTKINVCTDGDLAAVYVTSFNFVNKTSGLIDSVAQSVCVGPQERFGCSASSGDIVALESFTEYFLVVVTNNTKGNFYLTAEIVTSSTEEYPPPPTPLPPTPPPYSSSSPSSPSSSPSSPSSSSSSSPNGGNTQGAGQSPSNGSKKSGSSVGIILGVVFSVVAVLGLVGFAVYYRSAYPRDWARLASRLSPGRSKYNAHTLDDYDEFDDEYDSGVKGGKL